MATGRRVATTWTFGDVPADDVRSAAAAAARFRFELDDDLLARQMHWRVAAIDTADNPARRC